MKHIEEYLNNYLPRPLASREFWKKINSTDDRFAASGMAAARTD